MIIRKKGLLKIVGSGVANSSIAHIIHIGRFLIIFNCFLSVKLYYSKLAMWAIDIHSNYFEIL